MDGGDLRGLDARAAPSRLRWIAVALCVLYGFAKLTGSQFTVLDSELEKPLGRVSGFWLTLIHVWQAWLTKGTLLYEGRVRDDGMMELKSVGAAPPSSIVLRQRPRR